MKIFRVALILVVWLVANAANAQEARCITAGVGDKALQCTDGQGHSWYADINGVPSGTQNRQPMIYADPGGAALAGRRAAMEDAVRLQQLQQQQEQEGREKQQLQPTTWDSKTLDENKREADRFISDNRTKSGVVVLPSGPQYRVIDDGTGKAITSTSDVTFHVRVSLTSGHEIRSSFTGDPIKANVAAMPGIFGTKALPEVIQTMKAGDDWLIYLPPEPASGNRVFVWEVKILNVK